jgi:hypothetical protein
MEKSELAAREVASDLAYLKLLYSTIFYAIFDLN